MLLRLVLVVVFGCCPYYGIGSVTVINNSDYAVELCEIPEEEVAVIVLKTVAAHSAEISNDSKIAYYYWVRAAVDSTAMKKGTNGYSEGLINENDDITFKVSNGALPGCCFIEHSVTRKPALQDKKLSE